MNTNESTKLNKIFEAAKKQQEAAAAKRKLIFREKIDENVEVK
jgi:hypothetical protein